MADALPHDFAETMAALRDASARRDWKVLGALCAELRERVPAWPAGYRLGVVACRGLGDERGAERLLTEAVALFPDIVEFAIEYANVSVGGDPEETLRRWLIVRERFPSAPAGYLGEVRCHREAGRGDVAEALLGEVATLFPDNGDVIIDCGLGTTDAAARRRHWRSVPPAATGCDGYLRLTCRVLHTCNTDRDGDVIGECVDILLAQTPGKDATDVPYLVMECFQLRRLGSPVAEAVHRAVTLRLAGEAPWTPAGELYALAFDVGMPAVRWGPLVARHLLDEHHRRFSYVFGAHNLFTTPRAAELVPGLAALMLATGAVDRLSPDQIYRIAVVLYCTSRSLFDRFVATAAQRFPTDRPPTEPAGMFTHIDRMRRIWLAAGPPPATPGPLKIALCVSGQVRGFRHVLPSWSLLGLDAHDVDTYVDTWSVVGRRFPEPLQAQRVLSGSVLEQFRAVTYALGGAEAVKARYPTFASFFDGGDIVTQDELKAAYRTEHVVVEDDRGNPLRDVHNIVKMHYKIQRCVGTAVASGQPYDLIVRIRPDLQVEGPGGIDWHDIHRRSQAEGVIFADFAPCMSGTIIEWKIGDALPLMVGDLFAAGTLAAMCSYATVYTRNQNVIAEKHYGLPHGYAPHTSLALMLMREGVHVERMPGLDLQTVCDPEPLTTQMVYDLLRQDIGPAPRDELDRRLLDACEADLATLGA